MIIFNRSYKRFATHYKERGLLYSVYRGIKYALFLFNKNFSKSGPQEKASLIDGRLKASAGAGGVRIYWDNLEVTDNVGLNVALCALEEWTDSSKGGWIAVKKDSTITILNRWHWLPITLRWELKTYDGNRILWSVWLRAEEEIRIDKKKALIVLNDKYDKWEDLKGHKFKASAEKQDSYPDIALDFTEIINGAMPLAESIKTRDATANLLGIQSLEEDYYPPGEFLFFSAEIKIAEKRCQPSMPKRTKKPKVLILNLPWEKGGRWGVRAGSRWPHIKDDAEEGNYLPFPFFMAYAASLLRKHEFQAHLVDALAQKLPEDKLLSYIDGFSPDLLVVETSTPSFNHDMRLLEKIGNKDFKICLCGPDFNIRTPEFLKRHKFIDYVLAGEYEYTLLNLVNAIQGDKEPRDVCGLIYRDAGGVVVNPKAQLVDLDTLPWPLRDSLLMDKYLDTPGGIPMPSVQMLASRGCPFRCNFCLWPQAMYHGNKYRARNVVDVAEEMEYLIKDKGFKSVYFDDDTFNVGKERMLNFCSELVKRGLNSAPWAVMARADLMDEEILAHMKDSGLTAIKYGVESASQELLDRCGKGMDLKKTEEMIIFTHSLGIRTHLTFTFGLPGETKDTIRRTIDYASRLRPFSAQFSITTPFPGTEYFEELDKNGLVINKNWDDYDGNFKSVIKLNSLSSRELESARRQACLAWANSSAKGAGTKITPGRALRYLRKVKRNYLDVLGIFDGQRAFKGPNTIQIDLTDHCNNNCIACWCNSPLLSRERLDKQKYALSARLVKNLISQAHGMGLKEIYFSGGGEPFMHPDILQILEYAKRLGIHCTVNTNFTLINEETIQRFIDMRLDGLTVSVWAGTADVYKAMHPGKEENDFRRISDMLCLLNSRKNIYPKIKIYNVICNMNYDQIDSMLEFVHNTGSEYVEFTVVDTMPKATDRLILSGAQAQRVLRQFEALDGKFSILNLEHFLRRVSSIDAEKAEYDSEFIDNMPCYVGWLFARIMPNGDVNSCLKSHRFPVGNLHMQSFKKIWNSGRQKHFRKKALAMRKDDPFFSLIGNDPGCKMGCYKSCDDIGRNISMHSKISSLSEREKRILKILSKGSPILWKI